MSIVRVPLGARSYDIHIEAGLLDRAGDLLAPYARGGRLVVVTDANVARLQLPRLKPFATAARLGPTFVAQVALGAAVAQTKPWRIERARGQRVAEQRDHAALAQQGFCSRLLGGPALQGCDTQGSTQSARRAPAQQGAPREACAVRTRRTPGSVDVCIRPQAGRHSHCPMPPCGQTRGTGSGSHPAWRCWW